MNQIREPNLILLRLCRIVRERMTDPATRLPFPRQCFRIARVFRTRDVPDLTLERVTKLGVRDPRNGEEAVVDDSVRDGGVVFPKDGVKVGGRRVWVCCGLVKCQEKGKKRS
jgi:hypothetical protein